MKKRLTFIFRSSRERGIALILTLAIITLVTLILIAFAVSMRVENTASKSFNDVFKARELAQAAVDQAVATIRQATWRGGKMPGGVGQILNYVTFPGAIYDYSGPVTTNVPLYSLNGADVINLNTNFWITGSNGEFTVVANSLFNAGWTYVAENGATGPAPLGSPLVGRFAYWVDDEASKINLNTAGTPSVTAPSPPDYGTSLSNEVDLSVLLPTPYSFVGGIESRQVPGGPGFTTIEEIKLVDPSDSDFSANRFSITAYSKDADFTNYTDDLDVFDRQRLVVSSLNSGDITAGGNATNAYNRLSNGGLQQVYSSTGTFADKYNTVPNGLSQIIANIIAYQQNPTNAPPPDGGGNPPVYLGLGKTPYINEVQVSYGLTVPSPGVTNVTEVVSVELFYMYDGSYVTAPDSITVSNLPVIATLPTVAPAIAVNGTFGPGQIGVFAITNGTVPVTSLPLPVPSSLVDITYSRPSGRLDFSRVTLPAGVQLSGTVLTSLQGAEAVDPAVNDGVSTPNQWVPYTSGGSLGSINSSTYTGEVSKAVVRGAPMQSIGDLGYIHTPNPWQHLTLQPGGGNTAAGQIPDWAMLDLFTTGPDPVSQTSGRININSFINPGLTTPAPSWQRLVPLKALLNSMPGLSAAAALNIYNDDVLTARGGTLDKYGMRDPVTSDPVFDTIGEVCEIASLANGKSTQADKEQGIRRIANVITVRSQEFTIWAMAQSIKQVPTTPTIGLFTPGVDQITGEVRVQAVVERYENQPGSGNPPQFRVRYFRYLYN